MDPDRVIYSYRGIKSRIVTSNITVRTLGATSFFHFNFPRSHWSNRERRQVISCTTQYSREWMDILRYLS